MSYSRWGDEIIATQLEVKKLGLEVAELTVLVKEIREKIASIQSDVAKIVPDKDEDESKKNRRIGFHLPL